MQLRDRNSYLGVQDKIRFMLTICVQTEIAIFTTIGGAVLLHGGSSPRSDHDRYRITVTEDD